MEKRDMAVIVLAVVIVFVMAMYIKPLVTGKEVKIIPDELAGLLGGGKNQTESINNTTEIDTNLTTNASIITNNTSSGLLNQSLSNITNVTPNITATPVPTITPWNGSPITIPTQGLTYPLPPSRPYPNDSPNLVYSFLQPDKELLTFSTISGSTSLKTEPVYIPSSYWELWYTVELPEGLQSPTIGNTKDNVESVGVLNPQFTINVFQTDPEQKIRTITPEGGLNPELWVEQSVTSTDKGNSPSSSSRTSYNFDPRPWKETFYEGNKYISFLINAQAITSYQITIKVQDPNQSVSSRNNGSINLPLLPKSPEDYMRSTLNNYINCLSIVNSSEDASLSIYNNLSDSVKKTYSIQDMRSSLNQMAYAGIQVNSFNISNVFYRQKEGSVKGDFNWTKSGISKQSPWDITFIHENGRWKMDTLPIIQA